MFKGSKKHHFTFVYICIYLPFAVTCEQPEHLSSLLVGRNNNEKKRSVNALAREMLPKCRVNVQITLKFSNL